MMVPPPADLLRGCGAGGPTGQRGGAHVSVNQPARAPVFFFFMESKVVSNTSEQVAGHQQTVNESGTVFFNHHNKIANNVIYSRTEKKITHSLY